MNRKKALTLLFICLICGCLLIFLPEFLDFRTFIQGHDAERQVQAFYTEYKRLINSFFSEGVLPFYSWNTFLGTNFYASKTYLVFGEIFGLFGQLFDLNFFSLSTILNIFRIIVSGFTMYYLLMTYKFKESVNIIGALCYAFSSWFFGFLDFPTFTTFYAFAPLFFAGIDRYLISKKWIGFVVATTLLITSYYYYFFTLCFFAPIYYIFRYYYLNLDTKKVY